MISKNYLEVHAIRNTGRRTAQTSQLNFSVSQRWMLLSGGARSLPHNGMLNFENAQKHFELNRFVRFGPKVKIIFLSTSTRGHQTDQDSRRMDVWEHSNRLFPQS